MALDLITIPGVSALPSAGLFDPQDPEEEEEILLFAIILILVIPGGWKWAGDVLGEKLGNGRRWFYTPAHYPTYHQISSFHQILPFLQTFAFHQI